MSIRALAASALLILPFTAVAGPNTLVQQGRLLDSLGAPVEGSATLDVFLYRDDSGPPSLWTDEFAVDIHDGFYSITLGEDVTNPIGDDVFDGPLFLSISFNDGVQSPPMRLASSPYAVRAGLADGLSEAGLAQVRALVIGSCPGEERGGVCLVGSGPSQTFLSAAQFCASQSADICTDSQSTVLRSASALSGVAWTSSRADNDGGGWSVANGGTSDNPGSSAQYPVSCCINRPPDRTSDVLVGGVRLVFESTVAANWAVATSTCASRDADICSPAESTILRANGRLSGGPNWTSNHADNDGGRWNVANGGTSDNPSSGSAYRYACCATQRPNDLSCPATATDVGGVCMLSVNNSGGNWATATASCASQGAQICSISQSAVLRSAGQLTSAGNWTASASDNDGQVNAVGTGSVADNPSPSTNYGWACCY